MLILVDFVKLIQITVYDCITEIVLILLSTIILPELRKPKIFIFFYFVVEIDFTKYNLKIVLF